MATPPTSPADLASWPAGLLVLVLVGDLFGVSQHGCALIGYHCR
jgi:hypothetical protein